MQLSRFIFLMTSGFLFVYSSFCQNEKNSRNAIQPENKLAGTWRLIEYSELDSNGVWEYPFGKNPRGYFTYTKNFILNINISSEVPLKITADSIKNYSVNLVNYLSNYALGYFGTYSVDYENSIVTHHVLGGSIPSYINTDQKRPFVLKGDTLFIGDMKTWRRVLVRAD
jgi:Lipocalin-like domain